jgi:hypothetical protein
VPIRKTGDEAVPPSEPVRALAEPGTNAKGQKMKNIAV